MNIYVGYSDIYTENHRKKGDLTFPQKAGKMTARRTSSGLQAGMAELADVQDLGSCAARRVGSTPTTRTINAVGLFRQRFRL